MQKSLRLVAVALALVLVTGACTSDPDEEAQTSDGGSAVADDTGGDDTGGDGTDTDTGDTDTGDTTESTAPEVPQGSTKGITDDTIKIGFIGADFSALEETGLVPVLGDQEKIVNSIVEDINES